MAKKKEKEKKTDVKGISLYKKHLAMTDEESEALARYLEAEDIRATALIRTLLRDFMKLKKIRV